MGLEPVQRTKKHMYSTSVFNAALCATFGDKILVYSKINTTNNQDSEIMKPPQS